MLRLPLVATITATAIAVIAAASVTVGSTTADGAVHRPGTAVNARSSGRPAGAPSSAPPKITTKSLPVAELNSAYQATIVYTCADGPCQASLTGPLPPGLQFDAATSTLSGTPTATGKYPVTFKVVDVAGRSASRDFAGFAVYTGPVLTSMIPYGDVGTSYDTALEVDGGKPPYDIVVSSGTLPPGLALEDNESGAQAIAGTPSQTGTYAFTLTVTATNGLSNSFPESVTIAAAPSITTGTLPGGRTGIAYSQPLAVTGGTAPFVWSITAGTLPAGVSLDASTGTLSGTPQLPGSSSLTIGVVDSVGGAASASYTLTVTLWKPPLVPNGSLIGASVYPDHSEPKAEQILTFEKQIGRTLDVDNNYYGFDADLVGQTADADRSAGRIPLDSWTCADPKDIYDGDFDTQLEAQAKQVATFGYPIYLRWSWEMNQGSNSVCANKDGTAMFIAAWRHIWTIFNNAGATNAAWVWCPTRAAFANGTDMEYYPGDAYVDYVCADGYSRSASDPTSFSSIFGPVYKEWSARKPILIGETGQVPGTKQAPWVTQTGNSISTQYPDIKAFLYWDSYMASNYTLTTRASLKAFADVARLPYFNPLGRPLSPPQLPPSISEHSG